MRASLRLLPLICCALAGSAQAQYIAFRGERVGQPPALFLPATRLQGMGGLAFTIEDENRELNLLDFAQNVAGVASDKEGWSIEAWGGENRRGDDYGALYSGAEVRQRTVADQGSLLAQIFYRRNGTQAIGGTVDWKTQSVRNRYGSDLLTRGPRGNLIANQKIGPVRCGLGIIRWTDSEDVTSPDVFAIRHVSTVWGLQLGAAMDWAGLDWAAQAQFDRVTIDGKSRDAAAFHQDEFEWRRPATKIRLSALLPSGKKLEGGANVLILSRTGVEEGRLSWSATFPQNPAGIEFSATVPTFTEEEDGFGVEGQLRYRLTPRVRLAGYASTETFDSEVKESTNYIGSRRAEKVETSRARIGGGASTSLAGDRVLIGAEFTGLFAKDEVTQARSSSSVDSRDIELRTGVEWMFRPALALRAGYQRVSADEDTERPATLQLGHGATFGFGWAPRGGLTTLDAGLRLRKQTPKEDGGSERKTEHLDYSVTTRFVF